MIEPPLTISQTHEGLFKKDYSVVELVDSYLERIEKYNAKLNIFLTVSDSVAYTQAKKADKAISELGNSAIEKYPLLGCIVAHKDLFLTKGVRTTAGSKVLTDYIPAYSSTVVSRIEKAGAVMVGKLNCDAWAHGSSGENSDFSPTKNPWNLEYTPGGSSSGSGAALAANMCLIATGTDTCGSIRLPANYCYLFGLKPTYGAVSRFGVVAMASSLDSIGHLARTAYDTEKVFNITKGEDQRDSTVTNSEFPKPKAKVKIGIPKEFFVGGLEKEVEICVLDAIRTLKKAGVEFIEISLPTTKHAISVYYVIQPAEVSSNLGRYDGTRYGAGRETFGDEAKRRIMLGTYVLSAGYYDAYYLKAMKVRTKIREEVDRAFEKVDAIIAPVAPSEPFKLGEKVSDPLKMYLTDIFAATANLSGIPSLAVPSGFSKKNLPLGFQLMGPRFSEYVLFELGKLYERSTSYKPRVANL